MKNFFEFMLEPVVTLQIFLWLSLILNGMAGIHILNLHEQLQDIEHQNGQVHELRRVNARLSHYLKNWASLCADYRGFLIDNGLIKKFMEARPFEPTMDVRPAKPDLAAASTGWPDARNDVQDAEVILLPPPEKMEESATPEHVETFLEKLGQRMSNVKMRLAAGPLTAL